MGNHGKIFGPHPKIKAARRNYGEKDEEELKALLSRRIPIGKGRFKGKLLLICFKCNEIDHFSTRCPNKNRGDKKDKKEKKYSKKKE